MLPVGEMARSHCLGEGERKRLLRGDLRAQRGLARRLVSGIITVPGGLIVAEYCAGKLHEFKDAGKTEVGKESANAG